MPEEIDANVSEKPLKKKILPLAIVALLMIVEGIGVYFAVKALGSEPTEAQASTAEGEGELDPLAEETLDVEMPLCELDAFNSMSGKLVMYHVEVVAVVDPGHKELLGKLVEKRNATIRDRITTIIRQADPKYLKEPGLETIRRQIEFELNKVFGDENVIKELLIPKLLQS